MKENDTQLRRSLLKTQFIVLQHSEYIEKLQKEISTLRRTLFTQKRGSNDVAGNITGD